MNGFKAFAVGAFLYCGPTICHAQISILENNSEPRSILVRSGDERVQPAAAADLTRQSIQAEISADSPMDISGVSPSDVFVDARVQQTPTPDPASLPHAQSQPNVIDQILRNGLIAQTPNSAQVPVAWPMQQPDNPTARMMLATGCTAGLWDNYPAERAAECARMYQHLAKKHCAHGCGLHHHAHAACATCAGGRAAKPVNRYAPAPAACDSAPFQSASHVSPQPNFQSLLAPTPTMAEPLNDPSLHTVQDNQDNVAQLPGLIR